MLLKLANGMKLDGIAQVDLVFDGEKWFVIEVNPRLSGMSTTYAASSGFFLPEMIFKFLLPHRFEIPNGISLKKENFALAKWDSLGILNQCGFFKYSVNIKFPILARGKLLELKALPYVAFVNQIENHAARQIREQGYCEVILRADTRAKLLENLLDLRTQFSAQAEDAFFETAISLCGKL